MWTKFLMWPFKWNLFSTVGTIIILERRSKFWVCQWNPLVSHSSTTSSEVLSHGNFCILCSLVIVKSVDETLLRDYSNETLRDNLNETSSALLSQLSTWIKLRREWISWTPCKTISNKRIQHYFFVIRPLPPLPLFQLSLEACTTSSWEYC